MRAPLPATEPTPSPARPPRRLPSLRTLITLIVVVPIASVSAALVLISGTTTKRIAEDLGDHIVYNTSRQVGVGLKEYLTPAVRVSDLFARRLASGRLRHETREDLEAWEPFLFDSLSANPGVASICFANARGDATWLLRHGKRIEWGIADGLKDKQAVEYEAALSTARVLRDRPIREYRYDASSRPWYSLAVRHHRPLWSPIYFWFGESGPDTELGSGYTRAVRDREGNLLGVLVVDVTLSAASQYLSNIAEVQDGSASVFIVDDLGLMVAASEGPVVSQEGKRIALSESQSATARAIAPHVRQEKPAAPAATGPGATTSPFGPPTPATVNINHQTLRVTSTPLYPEPGTAWQLLTVVPEASFLAQAQSMARRATFLACAAVLFSAALGLWMSRRISRPLLKLAEHVARIGAGDFESRLELSQAKELQRLSAETNRMAASLRHRVELEQSLALAVQVQQSLLPNTTPDIPGLQIAGRSHYCESTGGDYFDFIELAGSDGTPGRAAHRAALLAVGDVMGHGIGSALLMATARGATRAAVTPDEPLGRLLHRVNNTLSRDARHGRFMTLSLLLIDPADARVRYASAGHDPAILYDPSTDQFSELEGGGIPLGIYEDTPYEEYHRCPLPPGALLFIGTDGVWDARTPAGEFFGKSRVREFLRANAAMTPHELAQELSRTLKAYAHPAALRDDMTFVIVKYAPSAAGTPAGA